MAVAPNGATTLGIGGTKTTGNILTVVVYDAGLTGGSRTVNYTVTAGDTIATIPTNLAAAITADTNLQGIGVSASASGSLITINSNSPNLTSFRQSVSASATVTMALNLPANGTETLVVGGVKKTSDVMSVTVYDAGLTGGSKTITYTVPSNGTLTSIATNIAANINADTNLAAIGVTATSSSTVVNIKSTSQNATTYTAVVTTAGGTETLTLAAAANVTTYGYNALNELTNAGPGGALRFQGSTNKPVKSASIGTPVVWLTSKSTSATTYTKAVVGTETITLGNNLGGNQTATIAGTITTGNTLTITVNNAALPGGLKAVNYVVVGGDTLITIAAGLAAAINADTDLQGIGVSASSTTNAALSWSQSFSGDAVLSPGLVTSTVSAVDGGNNTKSNSALLPVPGISYTQSVTGTETITFGANTGNGNTTATIGGSKTTGNVLNITVFDQALPGGKETVSYTVLAGDTLTTITTALKNALNADTKLQAIGLSTTSATTVITITVAGGNGQSMAYDANGNMTSDGTNTYAWDGEDRLVQITYPGTNNYSSFSYDGFGRNVKIVETVAGSVTSTKQFVWCSNSRCEARDGSSTITAQYFIYGQTISGITNKYFYILDRLGSIREMTDNSAAIQAQYSYDPYGNVTKLQGSLASDFQYAGYYMHDRSGLNLTATRGYSAGWGRFINRDPIAELAGPNVYAYVNNSPNNYNDPLGLYNPVEALGHYMFGHGETVSLPLNSIKVNPISWPSIPCIEKALAMAKKYPKTCIPFKCNFPASAGWEDSLSIGNFTGRVSGAISDNGDGSFSIKGDLSALNDVYDFNPSTHRGAAAEAATRGGAMLPGTPFNVNFTGSIPFSMSVSK